MDVEICRVVKSYLKPMPEMQANSAIAAGTIEFRIVYRRRADVREIATSADGD